MPCPNGVNIPGIFSAWNNYSLYQADPSTDWGFRMIRQNDSEEYLDALFDSGADVDVVFFGEDFRLSSDAYERYAEEGKILAQEPGSIYTNDGGMRSEGAGQILWINYNWLTTLGLSIPQTTEEFEEILIAFRDLDPNGNGLKDEIPMAGATQDYAYLPTEFLLNSFVYNDPYHSRYGVGEAVGTLNAGTSSFREGLSYCNRLYSQGLLKIQDGPGSAARLTELINSPEDIVGAFTTASISDVIYPGNPEVLARYVHVAPLSGPDGKRYAVFTRRSEDIGAVITASSTRTEEAKLLLDTMMSEEASLIARYGEEGVDWSYSEGQDVSVYGGTSTIVCKNYTRNVPQNKHLNGVGPMRVPERFIEGVTWNGVNSDAEYIDGRAQATYRSYLPDAWGFHERNERLSEYTDAWVREFITGEKKIGDDDVWEEYLSGLTLR